jgi:hypothetical protein
MVTTAISVAAPFSFRRRASSSAMESKGLTENFTPSVSMPEPSAFTRIFVSESGTRLSGTRIFMAICGRKVDPAPVPKATANGPPAPGQ